MKALTIYEAFKLMRSLKVKQTRRSEWLGPSPVYTSRITELQKKAKRIDLSQCAPSEVNMINYILKGDLENESGK